MEKEQVNPTDFSKLHCYARDTKNRQCPNVAAFYQRLKNNDIKWLCVEHVLPEAMVASTLAIK